MAGLSWQGCSVGSHVGPMAKRVVLREVPESVHMRLTTRVAVAGSGFELLRQPSGSATPCPNRIHVARSSRAPTRKQQPAIAEPHRRARGKFIEVRCLFVLSQVCSSKAQFMSYGGRQYNARCETTREGSRGPLCSPLAFVAPPGPCEYVCPNLY